MPKTSIRSARFTPPSQNNRNSMNSRRRSTPQRTPLFRIVIRASPDQMDIKTILTAKADGYSYYSNKAKRSIRGDGVMSALQKDETNNVLSLARKEPANDVDPIPGQGKKWRRVTINKKTLACALVAEA